MTSLFFTTTDRMLSLRLDHVIAVQVIQHPVEQYWGLVVTLTGRDPIEVPIEDAARLCEALGLPPVRLAPAESSKGSAK